MCLHSFSYRTRWFEDGGTIIVMDRFIWVYLVVFKKLDVVKSFIDNLIISFFELSIVLENCSVNISSEFIRSSHSSSSKSISLQSKIILIVFI
jgi:hypothetical protein